MTSFFIIREQQAGHPTGNQRGALYSQWKVQRRGRMSYTGYERPWGGDTGLGLARGSCRGITRST